MISLEAPIFCQDLAGRWFEEMKNGHISVQTTGEGKCPFSCGA